jgi:hypothetical protein
MCRSIKRLYDPESGATEEELHEAALQFVRKISGFRKPSRANEAAFVAAVDEIADASARLLASLHSPARARSQDEAGNKV